MSFWKTFADFPQKDSKTEFILVVSVSIFALFTSQLCLSPILNHDDVSRLLDTLLELHHSQQLSTLVIDFLSVSVVHVFNATDLFKKRVDRSSFLFMHSNCTESLPQFNSCYCVLRLKLFVQCCYYQVCKPIVPLVVFALNTRAG